MKTISRFGFLVLALCFVGIPTSDAFVAVSSRQALTRTITHRASARIDDSPTATFLRVPRSGIDDNAEDGTSTNLKSTASTGKSSYTGGMRLTFGQAMQKIPSRQTKHHVPLDVPIPASFVADTSLPTDVGQFRLRAYRTPQSNNEFSGNEPCVIYSADKSPFGSDGALREDLPVRIHDQCLTSEVFRSQRYVF